MLFSFGLLMVFQVYSYQGCYCLLYTMVWRAFILCWFLTYFLDFGSRLLHVLVWLVDYMQRLNFNFWLYSGLQQILCDFFFYQLRVFGFGVAVIVSAAQWYSSSEWVYVWLQCSQLEGFLIKHYGWSLAFQVVVFSTTTWSCSQLRGFFY